MENPVVNNRSVIITDHAFERMLQVWPHVARRYERLTKPRQQLHQMLEEARLTPFPTFRAFFREEAYRQYAECWSCGFLAFILVPADEQYVLVTVEMSEEGRERLKKRGRAAGDVYAYIKRPRGEATVG